MATTQLDLIALHIVEILELYRKATKDLAEIKARIETLERQDVKWKI